MREQLCAVEDELIRLNQAVDLVEKIYVDGTPEEYMVDRIIEHVRTLSGLFDDLYKRSTTSQIPDRLIAFEQIEQGFERCAARAC